MNLFARGRLPGFTHSYIGMEAVAAGVCVGLRVSDAVTSTHRGHGHAIAKVRTRRSDGRALRTRNQRLQGPRRVDALRRRRAQPVG